MLRKNSMVRANFKGNGAGKLCWMIRGWSRSLVILAVSISELINVKTMKFVLTEA